jgi:hypothetical protein
MSSQIIPADSKVTLGFTSLRAKPSKQRESLVRLIVEDENLSTASLQNPRAGRVRNLTFDEITGSRTWQNLVEQGGSTIILDGQGDRLVAEAGSFKERDDGKYVFKIDLPANEYDEDAITGQWTQTSIKIKVGSDPDDNSNTLVEGLAGLAVVGGGLVLYKKLRANEIAEAAEQTVEDSEESVRRAQAEVEKARAALEQSQIDLQAKQEELELAKQQLPESIRIEASAEKLLKKTTDEINQEIAELSKKSYKFELDRFFKDPEENPLPNGGGDNYLRLTRDRDTIMAREVELNEQTNQLASRVNSLEAANTEAISATESAEASLENGLNLVRTEQERLLASQKLQNIVEEELEDSLDEIAAEQNPYESQAFLDNKAAIEANEMSEVELLDKMIGENNGKYAQSLIQSIRNELGNDFNLNTEQGLNQIIDNGSKNAYDLFAEATCSATALDGRARRGKNGRRGRGKRRGVRNTICTEIDGIDPIVDVYAEEFTIEENMIFKGSHVFTELRTNLADIGYEAEVGELTDFVAGPEFAGEAGEFIGAFAEGTLVAEEAVGALDIASLGLGGGAFVDGLAVEVGGDFLLGEFALDLLELAIFI